MSLKLYLYLGLGVVAMAVGLYIMILRNSVLSLEADVKDLETENQMLRYQIVQSEKTITSLKTDYKAISEFNAELSQVNSDLRLQQQTLQSKLQRLNSGYTEMAKRHPKMLSNIINNAQKDTNACFERLSRGLECK